MRSTLRTALAGAAAAAALAVAAAPASAQSLPFTNWQLGGSLTVKKLHQSISIPDGSTFNGSLDLATGNLTGDVSVPTSTQTVRVLGIPTEITTDLVETGPSTGHVTISGSDATIDATASAILYIRQIKVLGIPLRSRTCRTASPIVLPLHYSGPLDLTNGFTFTGTTTLPRLTGCGLLDGPLTLLMSGPDNPFTITLRPPAS